MTSPFESSRKAPDLPCSEEGCERTIRDHAWGRIKSGWFFSKSGESFCPEHEPEWVAEWRARKAQRNT